MLSKSSIIDDLFMQNNKRNKHPLSKSIRTGDESSALYQLLCRKKMRSSRL